MLPVKCSVCGHLAHNYAVVGKNEALCMGGGKECFGWFAGYAYRLKEFRDREDEMARPLILASIEEQQRNMEEQTRKYMEMMGKVKDTLAKYEEYALVWELDRVGMLGR